MGDTSDLLRVCGWLALVVLLFSMFIAMLFGLADSDMKEKPKAVTPTPIFPTMDDLTLDYNPPKPVKPKLWECSITGYWHCEGAGVKTTAFEPKVAYLEWWSETRALIDPGSYFQWVRKLKLAERK